MVLLTVTPAVKAAIDEHCAALQLDGVIQESQKLEDLAKAEIGSPIDHHTLVLISGFLVKQSDKASSESSRRWRLNTLLKGTLVYEPPSPPKPEPTPEYKALMHRLRADAEQRQYERMTNPVPAQEKFGERFPNASYSFNPSISHGQTGDDQVDELTYQDVERQMALIINVLISIIACSVAIWIAARHWSVPQRLGLSMSGSGLVAVAEVTIYMGYIRRTKDAKDLEVKKVERKEVVETWVIDGTSGTGKQSNNHGVRYRKGKQE